MNGLVRHPCRHRTLRFRLGLRSDEELGEEVAAIGEEELVVVVVVVVLMLGMAVWEIGSKLGYGFRLKSRTEISPIHNQKFYLV